MAIADFFLLSLKVLRIEVVVSYLLNGVASRLRIQLFEKLFRGSSLVCREGMFGIQKPLAPPGIGKCEFFLVPE